MSVTCEQMTLWPGAEASTSSPAALLAKISALPDVATGSRAYRGAVSRFATCSGLPEASVLLGSLLKTCLLSELAVMTELHGSWNVSGTPSRRLWLVLAISEPRTNASESGLLGNSKWPTPATRDWRNDGNCPAAQARNSPGLPAAVVLANWPTPTVAEAGKIPATANYGQVGLNNHPAIRGTPTRPRSAKTRAGLLGQGKNNTNGNSLGPLNPRWVAQLQGLPADWTDLPVDTLSRLSGIVIRQPVPSSSPEP